MSSERACVLLVLASIALWGAGCGDDDDDAAAGAGSGGSGRAGTGAAGTRAGSGGGGDSPADGGSKPPPKAGRGADAGAGAGTGAAGTGSDAGTDGGGDAGSAGAIPDRFFACEVPSDCTVLPRTCCGVCEPTVDDLIAVNEMFQSDAELRELRGCGNGEQGPDCAAMQAANPCQTTDLTARQFATCNDQRCEVFDVREQPWNECENDDDCTLRINTGGDPESSFCCPCAYPTPGPNDVIAIPTGAEQDLQALICDESSPVCNDCVPTFPEAAMARCIEGHCDVVVDCGHPPPCL